MPDPAIRGRLFLLAGLALLYALYLAWYHCPYAGASDASGYMNSARLMLAGRLTTPVRVPDGMGPEVLARDHFVPLGFLLDATQQNLRPTYPVGLPLHFIATGWLIGLGPASTLVGVASALAFALLLYLTGREFGVRPGWSTGVALLGALSPLVLMHALQPMSDLVAAVWALAVMLCALRSSRHAGWAAGAGAAFAVAVLVRPTNMLLLLPVALALPPRLRTWIAFGLGGLPGALFLAGYNHALYGSYVTSGYGDVRSLFAAAHLAPTLWHYATWVPVVATPLALATVALPWVKIDWRRKCALLAWAGIFVFFYAAYEPSKETWWYLRFILPALPALGIAAALVLQQINYPSWFLASRLLPPDAAPDQMARGRILRLPVALLLFLAAAGWMFSWTRDLRATSVELDDRVYPITGRWVAEQLPPDAVLIAYQVSGAVLYYSNQPFIIPNYLTPADAARLDTWLTRNHRVLYAALYPHEESVVREHLPGRWEVVTRLRQVTIWRRIDPAPSPR